MLGLQEIQQELLVDLLLGLIQRRHVLNQGFNVHSAPDLVGSLRSCAYKYGPGECACGSQNTYENRLLHRDLPRGWRSTIN